MKYLIKILLVIVIAFIIYGYYIKNTVGNIGDKWVGIGVLICALVLMPVFLWHRYKNKNLDDYRFDISNKKDKKSENQ